VGFQSTFQERVIPSGNRAFGVVVTLTQGVATSAEFTAAQEWKDYETEDSQGYGTTFHARDFMFDKVDAVVGGVTVTPRAGDRITLVENGATKVYELLPIGSLPAFEEMPGSYRWRVHTKQTR
jgi:hypothetical protein